MMKDYILGIDTSAYTTSVAVVDSQAGRVIFDMRKTLLVPAGQKGLRQQDAVFQHLKNLPEIFKEIPFDLKNVGVVSVSSRPRNVEKSYMPVFTVGQNFGKVIAKTLNCDCLEYSHQENHIGASIIDDYKRIYNNILAIHISGGTTEFLSVSKAHTGYKADIIGGSNDITLGQLIDRIGTAMQFQFPCGLHMEKYIKDNPNIENIKIPRISGDKYINLSGMENYYTNLYNLNKYEKQTIIYSLFKYTAECIIKIIESLIREHEFNTIIITGGVASNSTIRKIVSEKFKNQFELIFPLIGNSSDNAIGIAFMPIIDRWYNEA
nr:hypothetical protein [Sedimentibacter sp.]